MLTKIHLLYNGKRKFLSLVLKMYMERQRKAAFILLNTLAFAPKISLNFAIFFMYESFGIFSKHKLISFCCSVSFTCISASSFYKNVGYILDLIFIENDFCFRYTSISFFILFSNVVYLGSTISNSCNLSKSCDIDWSTDPTFPLSLLSFSLLCCG